MTGVAWVAREVRWIPYLCEQMMLVICQTHLHSILFMGPVFPIWSLHVSQCSGSMHFVFFEHVILAAQSFITILKAHAVPSTAGRREEKYQRISWIIANDGENLRNHLILLQHCLDWSVHKSLLVGETPHTVDFLHASWPLLWCDLS